MSNITLFDFNSSTIRVVNVDGEPWFVASDICKILELDNVSMATNRLDGDERGVISLSDTLGTEQNYTIINESGFYSLVLGSRKLVAKPFKNWVTKEVLPSIRRTGKYESEKAKLEQQFLPKVSIKEIDDAAALFGKRFGLAYEQRYVLQQFKKHFPQLAGHEPQPEEKASVSEGEVLLTPTQIASELGLKYKTGNPDGKAVNQLLEKLGYQNKVDGRWSATEKAISARLCDRKPVDTNSRTQKDQLLWSSNIVVILKEHATVC